MDSLYYYKLEPGWYYIEVEDYDWYGGANYTYQLIVADDPRQLPRLPTWAPELEGIRFSRVTSWPRRELEPTIPIRWVMFFDISDLGLNKNVDKLSTVGLSPDILIGFQVDVTLPGTSIVAKPQDIVRFHSAMAARRQARCIAI